MGLVRFLFAALLLLNFNAGAATPAEIFILRDELNIEKQELQNLEDQLGQLRRQQRTLQRDINISIADLIRENNSQIENLTDRLQTQRSREAGIDRSIDAYLQQIIAGTKAAQEQVEYSIQDTERTLRQLQDRINFSPLYTVSAAITADPARQTLQVEYNQLTQQLANLRQQRERLSSLQVAQIQQLNDDRAYQKNQLMEDLSLLQESLSALRSENAQLESERVQAKLNLSAVEQQLAAQQRQHARQLLKVQNLDSALQKRQFE